ncbi:glycosyltransferase family A protein [Ruoffia tabacinasalis]|uniref:glycosyltransferase family 2 protein n=1 Tax=Ruoffia tabacinasalis TaxID=87458 RepID=UPI0030D549BC
MISIVIPTHKRVNLLKKTINSALDQTYKNTEIIVVSDGYDKETDLYMKTIENNQIKYYVYETNRGANYARNYGVKHSEGEYIAFLDDDDQWAKDKLERQNTELSKDNDYGLVYTGNKQLYIDTNDSFIYEPTISGDLSREIFSKNHIGSTSSVLIKKEIFEEVNGFDEKLGALQDYDLWIRVCQIAKIGVISAPLLIYTNDRNREQISNQINKYEDAAIQIKEKYKDFFLIIKI